jgi:hypothetical protein
MNAKIIDFTEYKLKKDQQKPDYLFRQGYVLAMVAQLDPAYMEQVLNSLREQVIQSFKSTEEKKS